MACSNHGIAVGESGGEGGDVMPAKAAAARPRRERTENAAKRRRQLIEATIDSLVEHGLSATTLVTVYDGAGLSQDRKRVVSGKCVSVRVDLGGRLIIKKKKQ